MPFSNYFAAKVLDSGLRGVAWTAIDAYVALHDDDPTVLGDPSTEITGGSYVRQEATFSAASNRATANSVAIKFLDMPAVTVTHVALWTAASGGQMIFYAALSPADVVTAGQTYTLAISDLAVTLT